MEAERATKVKCEYHEGVDGMYTCAECGAKPFRSGFLIEQEDLEGNLCVELDLEGRLYGRCYECCRGRGKYKSKDIYADLVEENATEETLEKIFRRECNKRHNKRSDVKKNEHALLKIKEWQELLAAVTAQHPELSVNKRRRLVFDFCKKAAQDAHDAMLKNYPKLCAELKQIARNFKEGKRIQAEEGDARGIPCPHPKTTGVEAQYLHQIMPNTNRFFICRNLWCSDEGQFFGYNTDWISTCAAGGWKFACPHCGHPYCMNLNKPGLMPANHIWHLEKEQSLMLAEWPDSLTERSINETAEKLAEHATEQKFNELSHEEVKLKIASAVSKMAVKLTSFKTMQLSPQTISAVANINAARGKNLEYSWDHIEAKGGYTGSFYKFVEGETPVMKAADCMDLLAMVYCLMLHDDP